MTRIPKTLFWFGRARCQCRVFSVEDAKRVESVVQEFRSTITFQHAADRSLAAGPA